MCTISTDTEGPAHALAMMVVADGRLDERKLAVLDRLRALQRLGVDRLRFGELARTCARDVGAQLCERSWLCEDHLAYIDALLDAVPDDETRLLICRLGSAAITADGLISEDERLVYEHVLAHWRVSQDMLTQMPLEARSSP